MKFKLIIMILSSFILSSSGMFYDSGAYVEGLFSTQTETYSDLGDYTTTTYGGSVGYFLNPNVEIYVGGSLNDEKYDDSALDLNGTSIDFGGAYHYKDVLDMNGNYLNLRFGAEYSMLTIDGEISSDNDMDASATNLAISVGAYLPMMIGLFDIIPFIVYSSNNFTMEMSVSGDTIFEESSEGTGTMLGMGINIGNFIITPLISIDDEGSTRTAISCSMGIAL